MATGGGERKSYLGVWSLDEFLIPKHPFISLESVIKNWPAHHKLNMNTIPCYILLRSRNLLLKHAFKHNEGNYPWIGVKFADDFQYLDLVNQTWLGAFNFILPAEQSFQIGIPSEAVCQAQLDAAYVDGGDFLSNLEQIDYDIDNEKFQYKKIFYDNINDNVSFHDDATKTAYSSSTMLYKYVTTGMDAHHRRLYNVSKTHHRNRYVVEFAPKVLKRLKNVNLDLIISLNLPTEAARVGTAVEHWPQYKTSDQESILIF